MRICEKCTGCTGCYAKCPVGAIEMIQNEKGFYVAYIHEDKCIHCNLCKKICPQNMGSTKKNDPLATYACWGRDEQTREESTSGGLFTVLSNLILEKNGVIFGAHFDLNFKVIHGYIEKREDLSKMRGSKYVQSYVGSSFKGAKSFLEKDRWVLFSGTACQIAGLKAYLGKEYPTLLTIDVLCHGVPSPKVFKDYKDCMSKNQDSIENIRFRYKKPSWTVFSMRIDYKNKNMYCKDTFTDPYIVGFLQDFTTNEVCSQCQYVGTKRVSDITLADFWGYISEKKKYRNNEKGISLCLVNTEKGKAIFKEIKNSIIYVEKSLEEAKNGNRCLAKSFSKNPSYDLFWEEYLSANDFEKVSITFFKPGKLSNKRKISLLFNNKAYLLPKGLRDKLIYMRASHKK